MPESFSINSSSGIYQVKIGKGLINDLIKKNQDNIFLIDSKLEKFLGNDCKKIILIDAIEESKSLESIPKILLNLKKLGANRKTHLIAIGGGVIQDIATFVASIFMRGISWSYLPSTLLGMVDSCIGGKSSINLKGYKNLIGNFYPPKDILIDLVFIKSLEPDQIIGGLLEAVKICYAKGSKEFLNYINIDPKFPLTISKAQNIIFLSLKTKKWFIEKDEFDQKERLLLNYGHTFGHALEGATNFAISHGVAVGIGMIVANIFSLKMNNYKKNELTQINALTDHIIKLLGKNLINVSKKMPEIFIKDIIEKFDSDKKHISGFYRVIIPNKKGALYLSEYPINLETKKIILHSYVEGLKSVKYNAVVQ